jgi:error-prone DNA polymerase
MQGFSEYGFPESHAVSFALIAYASSYMKCHYPAAFYAALLNSQPMGFYTPHALLQSAQREGLEVLPVSINVSQWDCTLEKIPHRARPDSYALRLGFRLVNSLSENGAKALLGVRRASGPWRDFDHFIHTTDMYRDDFTALAAARAFDVFGISRAEALWRAEAVPYRHLLETRENTINWRQESSMDRIQRDFSAFNTSLSAHPVTIIQQEQWHYPMPVGKLIKAEQLEKLPADRDVFVFGMLLVKQSPGSAKGMVFITLEDESGFINLVFSPDVYARFYTLVERQAFLCVVGKLQKANNYHSILVKRVFEQQPYRDVVAIRRESRVDIEKPVDQSQQLVKPRVYK